MSKGKTTLMRGPMPCLCFHVGQSRRVTLIFDCRAAKCDFAAPDEWGQCSHKQDGRYCTHVEARIRALEGLIGLAKRTLKELLP